MTPARTVPPWRGFTLDAAVHPGGWPGYMEFDECTRRVHTDMGHHSWYRRSDWGAGAPIMTASAAWPFDKPDREAVETWISSNEGGLLEDDQGVAAVGAIVNGYNPPFASIGMVVLKRARRRGYGTYLVEELKRQTYALGKIPRADCAAWNTASHATLLRAGFVVNARSLRGSLRANEG